MIATRESWVCEDCGWCNIRCVDQPKVCEWCERERMIIDGTVARFNYHDMENGERVAVDMYGTVKRARVVRVDGPGFEGSCVRRIVIELEVEDA